MSDPAAPDENLTPVEREVHATVRVLTARMERQAGFSSLSAHISEIFKLTSEDSNATAAQLVNVLGKDMTMSQRILSLANSAAIGSGAKDLPGAVLMLGLERVRICVTTALMEKQFGLGTPTLRCAMLGSFHSAVLAKTIARQCGVRNPADAFTAAMFHNLGRTLVIHYLAEAFGDIQHRVDKNGTDERTEAPAVLGLQYYMLGRAVGRHWHLADSILDTMADLPLAALRPGGSPEERLHACVGFANEVSNVLLRDPAERDLRIDSLLSRVAPAMDMDLAELNIALAAISDMTLKYSSLVRLTERDNPAIRGLTRFEPIEAPGSEDESAEAGAEAS